MKTFFKNYHRMDNGVILESYRVDFPKKKISIDAFFKKIKKAYPNLNPFLKDKEIEKFLEKEGGAKNFMFFVKIGHKLFLKKVYKDGVMTLLDGEKFLQKGVLILKQKQKNK